MLTNLIVEQLRFHNLKLERFQDIVTRLFAWGIIVRAEDGAEQRAYLAVAKRNLALSSYNCYQQIADDHLFPMWNTKPVAELTTRELRNWIMTLGGKRKTVQLIVTPLRNTLEQALVDELIETNPFDSIRLNKILARDQMQSSFRADPFDIDEIEAILKACERQQEGNMFRFAFCTGMRPSEYIAQE
jgi:integrase